MYIVTKPKGDDGLEQNKKVTVDYVFEDCCEEGCELVMLVEDQSTYNSKKIKSGESFEIDTTGDLQEPDMQVTKAGNIAVNQNQEFRFRNIVSWFGLPESRSREYLIAPYGSKKCIPKKVILYVSSPITAKGSVSAGWQGKTNKKTGGWILEGDLEISYGLSDYKLAGSVTRGVVGVVSEGEKPPKKLGYNIFSDIQKKLKQLTDLLGTDPSFNTGFTGLTLSFEDVTTAV